MSGSYKERKDITIEELFVHKGHIGSSTYTDYDMVYGQSYTQIHRYPELYHMMREGLSFQYNDLYKYAKIIKPKEMDFKELMSLLYICFSEAKYMAVYMDDDLMGVELVSSARYIDESFEVMRNRSLFELRDFLSIDHKGKGEGSKMLPSKYSGRFFSLEKY